MTKATDSGTSTYTVGVFQDVKWADRGLQALIADGFVAEALSIFAKASPEAATLVRTILHVEPHELEIKMLGTVMCRGPLVSTLQSGDEGLERLGLAGTFRRAGFQAHDGFIYERLVERGGVLVAVRSVPRAADALARLHAYGGGNAAIGAWAGRV